MKKIILIALIGFGIYKQFFSLEEVVSSEYKFKIEFPFKPSIKTDVNKLPNIGRLKVTSYEMRKDELFCVVSVTDPLDNNDSMGGVEDTIRPTKRHLTKGLGGTISSEDYVFSGSVKGYEVNLLDKNNKLVKNRTFIYENNAYGLLCSFSNAHVADVDAFMQSFSFI
ncbi:MAG: hypothetical protein WBC60_13425 [Cognaticolwellia sp.]